MHLGRWRGRRLHEAAFLGEVVAIDPTRDAVVSDRTPKFAAITDYLHSICVCWNGADGSVILGRPATHDKCIVHYHVDYPK